MEVDMLINIESLLMFCMIWNTIFTFSISLSMASCQREFLFFSLTEPAFLTIFCSLSPSLWNLLRYQALHCFIMDTILFLFFKTWWTHQLNSGSFWRPWSMAYLATWIGCNSLQFDNLSHNFEPSFHLQQMSQPTVDFLKVSLPSTTSFQCSTLRAETFFSMIDEHLY